MFCWFTMEKYSFLLIFIALWHNSVAITCTYFYMDDNCNSGINSINVATYDQIRLMLTAASSYDPNMRCQLTLTTSLDSYLMVYFKDLDIQYSSGCLTDYLGLHDGISVSYPYIAGGKQCGSVAPSGVYTTSQSDLTLYFKSGSTYPYRSGFDIIVTSYHLGSCYSWEYDCDNGRCIDDSLTCNGYNPCGDYSDCYELSVGGIAGIIVGGVAFIVIVIIVIVVCRRRRVIFASDSTRSQEQADATATVTSTSSYGYNQPVQIQY